LIQKFPFFFSNYLIGRKTWYLWNNFISPFFNIDIGVRQGSALYILLIFYIFEKQSKNLNIPVSFLFFINNILLVLQEKSFEKSNTFLFYSYNIISFLINQFRLVIEHGKSEIFYFFRFHRLFNPPSLNLFPLRRPTLYLKDSWEYLGFIFHRKLLFWQHVNFYANKLLSTVKCMKILGNSIRGLLSYQKCLLYRLYVFLIVLYEFSL